MSWMKADCRAVICTTRRGKTITYVLLLGGFWGTRRRKRDGDNGSKDLVDARRVLHVPLVPPWTSFLLLSRVTTVSSFF